MLQAKKLCDLDQRVGCALDIALKLINQEVSIFKIFFCEALVVNPLQCEVRQSLLEHSAFLLFANCSVSDGV
jgi:hypothetical protein